MILIICASSFVTSALYEKIEIKNQLINSNDDKCCDDLFPLVMKDPLMDPDPNGIFDKPKPTPIDTPDYFNWADYNNEDWTTPARDQGMCGSCWIFAAVAVIESVINIQEGCSYLDLDLAEQYVLSCLPKAGGGCRGGIEYRALKYIIDTSEDGNFCNGIILESCMPYQANDTIPCENKCSDWEEKLIPLVSYGKWNAEPEDRELIKTEIMESGPVAVSMWVSRDFVKWHMTSHDPSDYFPFVEERYTNHVVLMVGWKDDPSIGNGGYWICKNSWGSAYGYNGFFNIEYGSLHIDDSNIVSVVYDPESFNCPPFATGNGLYHASIGEEITFDSTGSFDAEGEITSYNWNLGDETEEYGAIVKHIYQEKSIYLVTLTITDEDDKTGIYSTWAFIDTVNNPPDKPTINGPKQGKNLTWYNYTFSTSDPEMDNVYYYFDWGECDIDEWIGPFSSGEEVTLEHYWRFRGTYEIRVKAKDIYGYESEWATLKVEMSKNKPYLNTPFLQFLQNHPLICQLLQRVLKL